MSFILNTFTQYFERELCASDDCIVAGDASTVSVKAPLVDIAIGKFLKMLYDSFISNFHHLCSHDRAC